MAIGVRIINKFSISDYAIKRFAFLIYFLLNERGNLVTDINKIVALLIFLFCFKNIFHKNKIDFAI